MQDNSWYEKGELPPVGTECEFFLDEQNLKWLKMASWREQLDNESEVKILAHIKTSSGSDVAVFSFESIDGTYVEQAKFSCFRPIKSEREKAIEEMKKIVNSLSGETVLSHAIIFGALYDAGLRFTKAE